MNRSVPNILSLLNSRRKTLGNAYPLQGGASPFGSDIQLPQKLEMDESRMSLVIPIADGNRRENSLLPSVSVYDVTNSWSAYFGKLSTYSTDSPSVFMVEISNFFDLLNSEFGPRTFWSPIIWLVSGPVYYCIFHIFGSRTPAEISETVIRWVSVWEVTGFHTFWSRTDERCEYQSADSGSFNSIIFVKIDISPSSVLSVDLNNFTDDSPFPTIWIGYDSSYRFDSTSIRDSIIAYVVWNVSPKLFTSIFVRLDTFVEKMPNRIAFRHDLLPSRLPEQLNRAGGRETAFRVYSPSPRSLYKTSMDRKGGFSWN